jgi:hypothetical protein
MSNANNAYKNSVQVSMISNFFEICYVGRIYVQLTPQLWNVNIRFTLEDSASLRVVKLVAGDGTSKEFYENL